MDFGDRGAESPKRSDEEHGEQAKGWPTVAATARIRRRINAQMQAALFEELAHLLRSADEPPDDLVAYLSGRTGRTTRAILSMLRHPGAVAVEAVADLAAMNGHLDVELGRRRDLVAHLSGRTEGGGG